MYAYLYSQSSESGNALAIAIGAARIRHENSRFRGSPDKTVINWGCGALPIQCRLSRVVNKDTSVHRAIDKRLCLTTLTRDGVPCVEHTRDRAVAALWSRTAGDLVYARVLAQGHDGAGLVLVSPGDNIPNARLYTRGVPIDQEYRVTCVSNRDGSYSVLAGQRKVKHDDAERTTNNLVRTSSNGWGFKLINHERYLPQSVGHAAVGACRSLDLDFCGIDVVLLPDGSARVLEVNTAPELTPTVLRRLAAHLTETWGG